MLNNKTNLIRTFEVNKAEAKKVRLGLRIRVLRGISPCSCRTRRCFRHSRASSFVPARPRRPCSPGVSSVTRGGICPLSAHRPPRYNLRAIGAGFGLPLSLSPSSPLRSLGSPFSLSLSLDLSISGSFLFSFFRPFFLPFPFSPSPLLPFSPYPFPLSPFPFPSPSPFPFPFPFPFLSFLGSPRAGRKPRNHGCFGHSCPQVLRLLHIPRRSKVFEALLKLCRMFHTVRSS